MNAESGAEISSSGRKLEVAMMIDLTGSMGSTRGDMTKIPALKLAGADLLEILYPNGDNTLVKTAIAPVATYVNAGPYAAAATGLSSTGRFANRTDLAESKHGADWSSYSGTTGNSAGSGAAATSSGEIHQRALRNSDHHHDHDHRRRRPPHV